MRTGHISDFFWNFFGPRLYRVLSREKGKVPPEMDDDEDSIPAARRAAQEHSLGKKAELSRQSDADRREQLIPAGMCYVLGDNRNDAHDSREYGLVALGDIIGVAEYVYLPGDSWLRFGALRLFGRDSRLASATRSRYF
jgi:hypothetical protein